LTVCILAVAILGPRNHRGTDAMWNPFATQSMLNLFNRPPPLDITTYGGSGGAAYDAALHQAGVVGRFFTVGGSWRF